MATFGLDPWYGADLAPDVGAFPIDADTCAELDCALEYLRSNPLPILASEPRDFELPATRELALAVRHELQHGCGFALIDRLPTDRWGVEDATVAYWLLSSCIARPVAQSFDGKLVYDVTDKGRPPGNGVRPDVTNAGQNFHTDNSYNHCPPDSVGLLCLAVSKSGGESGIVNFAWALEQMREHYPQLLERLHEPYYFDRQREHGPDEVMTTHHPLFETRDGRLVARLSHRQVVNGQRLAGGELDGAALEALEALESLLNDPGAAKNFWFEPGQIQYVNNLAIGHRRSAFVDSPAEGYRRHLVRLWLRDSGRRGYGG
jgi:alpha-ketoglutarate-dependent taurine dioxygenase